MNQREEKKDVIMQLLSQEGYIPMKAKEIAYLLNLNPKEKKVLGVLLEELVKEGQITISKKGKYQKADNGVVTGIFEANRRGFGFVRRGENEEDIFIGEKERNGAYDHDTVQVQITKKGDGNGKRAEGKIVKIIERGTLEVVGIYEKSKNFGFVIPDNGKFDKHIFILKERSKGAMNGHKVVVKITNYGNEKKKPEGIVTEILGHVNDPGTDILSVLKDHQLEIAFPKNVMQEVEHMPQEVSEEDTRYRVDLRNETTITIDGADAKDLDDAITLTKDEKGYHLGVHIADVSHYVRENTALDEEAKKRATSVYLVDRVIPMLPHALSNGICSLNEGVDRLTLSCLMDVDEEGKVTNHRICETVIRSNHRMTYSSVKTILENEDPKEIEKYKEILPMLQTMKELSGILREHRMKRGSINFDFPESKVKLDEKGVPVEIIPYERNVATDLIEDFMLLANETVAEEYFWQEIPFLYRTHEIPDSQKMEQLAEFIRNFGYTLKSAKEHVHPKEIQKLLKKIEGTKEEALITRLALRSMKQAKYTTENIGHFGLSASYYCHFTSPIRRYPDLQIQRIIKENLHGKMKAKRIAYYENYLPKIADLCSKKERVAEDTEREVLKMKKAEFMEQHIGEQFSGVISGITNYGIFVELPNTVEGFVPANTLMDDFYIYDEHAYVMRGKDLGREYKLGQSVDIVVDQVNMRERTIDFIMAQYAGWYDGYEEDDYEEEAMEDDLYDEGEAWYDEEGFVEDKDGFVINECMSDDDVKNLLNQYREG